VQRSAFPEAYAKHEPDAALLASVLTGRAPASFTCSAVKSTSAGDPAQVRARLTRVFGAGIRLPAGKSEQHSELTLPVAPAAAGRSASDRSTASRHGWELAHWAVANSFALHIERVSYAGREWVAGTDGDSWRTVRPKSAGSAGSAAQGPGEVRIALVT
jgi:hypothetical protein